MRSVVLYPSTVEPEKMLQTGVYGAEMYAVNGSYDDCSRLIVELAGELDWAFVNVNLRAYYAEGSKTLAFEIAEELGWEHGRRRGSDRFRLAFTKLWQGFEQFRQLGLVAR
jgi:threonine synthase